MTKQYRYRLFPSPDCAREPENFDNSRLAVLSALERWRRLGDRVIPKMNRLWATKSATLCNA
jgi:hypothetical protein